MADRYLNQFLARGSAAQRAAFTPSPPSPDVGPVHAYLWWDIDTELLYAWDGATWVQVRDLTPASAASRILLRGSAAGAGDWQEGTIGAGLTLSGTTLDAAPRTGAISLVIDGSGAVITTGAKGYLPVPFACTITGWTLLSTDASATSGSIVIDIWKDVRANYPPTIADTITASAKPTLSSVNNNASTTLTGWTTSIAAGDVLGFHVDSVSTVTKIALTLTVMV